MVVAAAAGSQGSDMPLFDILCRECGVESEVLVLTSDAPLACPECGATDTQKLMPATSSLTGRTGQKLPGPGDHGCCGTPPSEAGCAGPGTCCGGAGLG